VLGPQQREDGQLEVVRLPFQQLLDPGVLPIREAELAVKGLFRDRAQKSILAAGSAGTAPHTRRGRCVYPRQAVSRRDALLLVLLSAIWGASFLFIKLGVDVLAPSVVVLGRLVFGAMLLLALLPGRGGFTPLRGHLRPLLVLGALNNAIPFWLLGFAEIRLDSGLTAVIQAAAPIFTVILAARFDVSQRVTGIRLIGIAVGFVGVALLVGLQSGGNLVAAFAVIGVALCYAGSVLFAGRTVRTLPPLQVSLGQLLFAAVLMAPFALAQLPGTMPSTKVWLAVIALGVLSSGVAYLLYFTIIASAGASRAILVTYLVPAFALVYGAVFLDESVTVTSLIGLTLVLAGTALATGLARVRVGRLGS
jgi:drug/metabolite transporter (DMT)-like permease